MYCVPYILQTLTGSADLTSSLGDQPVTDVYIPVLIKKLREQGWSVQEIELGRHPTVLSLARHLRVHTYIVTIREHVLLLKNGRIIDNGYSGEVQQYRYKLHKVEQVWEVWK